MNFTLTQIGIIIAGENVFHIQLDKKYISALTGLDGYSHFQMLWWFDKCDNSSFRNKLTENKQYTKGPDILDTFSTRSPERPNPIVVSCAYVTYIDYENGIMGLAYTDAFDGTPVLKTPRLIIRTLTADDVPALCEWMSDKSIYCYGKQISARTTRIPHSCLKSAEADKKLSLGHYLPRERKSHR